MQTTKVWSPTPHMVNRQDPWSFPGPKPKANKQQKNYLLNVSLGEEVLVFGVFCFCFFFDILGVCLLDHTHPPRIDQDLFLTLSAVSTWGPFMILGIKPRAAGARQASSTLLYVSNFKSFILNLLPGGQRNQTGPNAHQGRVLNCTISPAQTKSFKQRY